MGNFHVIVFNGALDGIQGVFEIILFKSSRKTWRLLNLSETRSASSTGT